MTAKIYNFMKPKQGELVTRYFALISFINIVTDIYNESRIYIGWLHIGIVISFK